MDAQELQNLNIAGIYHTSTGQTLREQDVPEVTKFTEAVIKAWAERAVSPAESVQSIDGAVFQGLLADYCDAYCALNGGEERTMDCMDSLLGYINNKLTAAHAEGRRSAMEELSKEKEVAYAAGRRNGARDERIASKAEAEEATLLSQPLQQEGGKEQGPIVFMDEIDAAQAGEKFLEQYYSRSVRMEYSPNDGPQIPAVKWTILLDWKDRIVAGYLLTRDLKNWTQLTRFVSCDAAPHPSDNLQQASTAQVEPAKEDTFETGYKNLVFVLRCIASGHHNSEELARNVLKHGLLPDTAATTQATPEGAELPPLPLGIGAGMYFTVDQMRDYAHRALAATTAAEPVYGYRMKMADGDYTEWRDCSKAHYDHVLAWPENGGFEVRTLYRAAPPQQVDTGGLPG